MINIILIMYRTTNSNNESILGIVIYKIFKHSQLAATTVTTNMYKIWLVSPTNVVLLNILNLFTWWNKMIFSWFRSTACRRKMRGHQTKMKRIISTVRRTRSSWRHSLQLPLFWQSLIVDLGDTPIIMTLDWCNE